MKKLLSFLSIFFVFGTSFLNGQNHLAYLSYVFPQDSLIGFNQMGANNTALQGGYFGLEYKVFMYRAKRNYINAKYAYYQFSDSDTKNNFQRINTAPCVNGDFEASPTGSIISVSGWTISEGSNTSSCTMGGCCPAIATGTNSWIRNTPLVTSSYSISIPNSPLGGSKVIQLGDYITNKGEVIRMEQTFSVTASSPGFQYAVFALMDGTGHACCDQPFLNISLFDCSNILIPGTTYSFVASGANCTSTISNWVTSTSGLSYHTGWQVFNHNLSAYIGSCVRVQVTVGDCDGWAHPGYCFFDAQCGPTVTTGIDNSITIKREIKIFPNPNTGDFVLQSTEEEIISITNGLGQIIKTVKLSPQNNFSVTINDLASGIYFASGKNFREKIIVTR